MQSLRIINSTLKDLLQRDWQLHEVAIGNHTVTCAQVEVPDPSFSGYAAHDRRFVVVRVKAFSCNYRDRSIIINYATRPGLRGPGAFGSEFSGVVVDCGADVSRVRVGDRVIGDNHYTGRGAGSVEYSEGVVTNGASQEYLVLHENKVMPIPASMPYEIGAAFSLGAQTAYSMVRKLGLACKENALVTSAKSCTSLFAIGALCSRGVRVFATSSSSAFAERLVDLGVEKLVVVPNECNDFSKHECLTDTVREFGAFEGVIDPYFDLNVGRVLPVMSAGGRYVTCGHLAQWFWNREEVSCSHVDYHLVQVLHHAVTRNISIIGNSIGLTSDLLQAISDYEAGNLSMILDSVHGGGDVAGFLARTYGAPDRFGKVVYTFGW